VVLPDFRSVHAQPAGAAKSAAHDGTTLNAPARKSAADTWSATSAGSLLWRIEDGHAQPSYLLGTMHLADPRLTRLPPAVRTALAASRSLTTEVLSEQLTDPSLGELMFFRDGRTLADVAGAALADETVRLLAGRGIPRRLAQVSKPWAAILTLSMPRPNGLEHLELVLERQAREAGLARHGLETATEQFAVLDGMPMSDQVLLLKETIAGHDQLAGMTEDLVRAYLSRDLDQVVAAVDAHAPRDRRVYAEFRHRLIDERNVRMLKRMLPRLAEGGAFVAVGALHLPGDNGLLAGLQRLGYRLSPVF
jgi:hypothetical protein